MTRHRRAFLPALLITLGLALSGCSDNAADAKPNGSGSPSESETGAAPAYQVVNSLSDYTMLEPGKWAVQPEDEPDGPRAIFDIPSGWISSGDFFIPDGEGTWRTEGCCFIGVWWKVVSVYKNPCTTTAETWPKVGPSVEDFANALVAQNLTEATKPAPVTLDGYDGLYLKLTGPADLDISTCTAGTIDYWESDPGTRYEETPGKASTDYIWILDLAGRRILIDIATQPGASGPRLDQMMRIVQSVHFEL